MLGVVEVVVFSGPNPKIRRIVEARSLPFTVDDDSSPPDGSDFRFAIIHCRSCSVVAAAAEVHITETNCFDQIAHTK